MSLGIVREFGDSHHIREAGDRRNVTQVCRPFRGLDGTPAPSHGCRRGPHSVARRSGLWWSAGFKLALTAPQSGPILQWVVDLNERRTALADLGGLFESVSELQKPHSSCCR